MCHALLNNLNFFHQLLQIDQELADQTRRQGCSCGGTLHQAHFPRKPRSCPREVRDDFASRFSFCCGRCRRRVTSVSVRFLGRRVHLALAVVLVSDRGATPAAARLAHALAVSPRTVQRWRQWWREHFPRTGLWQAMCARFMPPVDLASLPEALLSRFPGTPDEAMRRLLMFLAPLTGAIPVTLRDGR